MSTSAIRVPLATLERTAELARALGDALKQGKFRAVMLFGPMGAGKTTLVRQTVLQLPGGEEAEVASPSFNSVNLYPTRPEVAHFDLYRLQQTGLDDELLELLHDPDLVSVVEWAEHLDPRLWPQPSLTVRMEICGPGRAAVLQATDPALQAALPGIASSVGSTEQAVRDPE
ncbi:MAG: tRNA (adenosine(37)-N6)-threonylcarbamoyltransferase complex ATPase subunit type 1 TsaE [Desulfohalobiaceae bacterium]